MGISIHYRGQLDRIETIPKLLDELADIARSMRWECRRIEPDADNREFSGVVVSPGDSCESLAFLFDRAGRLRNFADLITNQIEPDPRSSFYVSVKTQFAAIKTHIWIIGLLRYLKKKYLTNLAVTDEGGFWETGNTQTLAEKRRFLQGKIDRLADGIEALDHLPENLDQMVAEIERIVRGENEP